MFIDLEIMKSTANYLKFEKLTDCENRLDDQMNSPQMLSRKLENSI
jgi:hypothetical protein